MRNAFWKDSRLMILGCGYIGEKIALEAIENGACVHALTRNAEKAKSLLKHGADRVFTKNIQETAWHKQTDLHYDYVLNCVSASTNGVEGYQKSYVEGMRNICQWSRSILLHAGTLIYTSSTGVYPQNNYEWVTEDSPTEPRNERSALLLEAERILQDEIPCARWFILRFAGIYGIDRHSLLDTFNSENSTLHGNGSHIMNLIYSDDAAAAITTCFSPQCPNGNRIYNVSDNCHATKETVVTWLANRLNKPVPTFSGEVHGFRNVPNRKVSSDRIQSETAWSPRIKNFRQGFEKLLQLSPSIE